VGTQIDTDDVLLARVRDAGDGEAFGLLYERHAAAARRFARSLCGNDADADDITAEVFTGLLVALRRGNGPSQLAQPYLFASVKHRYWRTAGRRTRETATASMIGATSAGSESTDIVEAHVLRSLATLPDHVQALLLRSEVDGASVDDALDHDAVSAHNLAVSRHRARRALGTAYLAQHVEPDGGRTELDPGHGLPVRLRGDRFGYRERVDTTMHRPGWEVCIEQDGLWLNPIVIHGAERGAASRH
jgi:DNA-directed RNA polymerase specialized sigma24 family protein